MNKPDRIPQDIWEQALRDSAEWVGLYLPIAKLIAETVMAERQKCAAIAGPVPLNGIASNIERQAFDLRTVIRDDILKGSR